MAARGSASSAWGGAPSAARPAVADLVATRRAQRVARAEDCLRGAGTIVLYLLVGPALMILNKEILSPSVGFPYPMMLSSFGLLLCSALAHGAAALGLFAPRQRATMTRAFLVRSVAPVGVCHALTLAAGNAQYLYMGVAMVQFLKSFTPVVVAVVSHTVLGRRERTSVWLSLLGLCFGTALTAAGDAHASALGLALAATSSATEALRLVLTQYVLQDMSFTIWEAQYYLSPAGGACLLLVGAIFEGPKCFAAGDFAKLARFPLLFFGAATLGLGVQLLTPAVIKATSSTTLKVISQARNAGVVVFGVVMYGELIGGVQLIGYVISLGAFSVYSYLKQQAAAAAHSAAQAAADAGLTKPGSSPKIGPTTPGGEKPSSPAVVHV